MKIPDNQAPPTVGSSSGPAEPAAPTTQSGSSTQSAFSSLLKKKQVASQATDNPFAPADAGADADPTGGKGRFGNLRTKDDGKQGDGSGFGPGDPGKGTGDTGKGPKMGRLGDLSGGPGSKMHHGSGIQPGLSRHLGPTDSTAGASSLNRQASPISARKVETHASEPPVASSTVTPQARPEVATVQRTDMPTAEVKSTGSAAPLDRIQALANEMVDKVQVTTGQAGNDKVDIQFNSQTLQGLQVSIQRNDGKVSVQFNPATEQVSQLLSQNMQSLSQALAQRGVDVAEVRVTPPPSSDSSSSTRSRSDRDSRQGGGRQSGGDSAGGGGGSSGGGQRGGR